MHAPRTFVGRIALVVGCLLASNATLLAQDNPGFVASVEHAIVAEAAGSSAAPVVPAVTIPPVSLWQAKGLRLGLFGTFAVLQALDTATTLRAVDAGSRELNPLMAGLADRPVAFVATKAAFTTTSLLLMHSVSKQHPKAAIWTAVLLNAAYGFIVVNNVHQLSAR